MERLRIVINFKNNDDEIAIYNKIKQHSSPSAYIKDLLRGLIVDADTSITKEIKREKEDIYDGIDDIIGG